MTKILDEDAREPCPYCEKDGAVISLLSYYWCNQCEKAFSPLEAEQHKEIIRLRKLLGLKKKCA